MAYAPFGEGYVSNAWTQFTSNGSSWTVQSADNCGLDDFLFRRYSPVQGRWTTPDPAGLAAVDVTNPQSWNRYAYVGNNPLSFVDPLGLDVVDCPPDEFQAVVCVAASSGIPGGVSVTPSVPFDPGGLCAYTGICVLTIDFGGGGDNPCYYVLRNPCGAANNGLTVPKNPCQFQGRALSPGDYATSGQQAANSTTNFVLDVSMGFPAGHYLDPQPLASGNVFQRQAYGNYTFGVYMAGAGVSLNTALSGANTYAFFFSSYPKGTPMDPNYGSLPAASVTNIRNGYNAYANGTVCHN